MAEYRLDEINLRAAKDAGEFIMECETHYRTQVSQVAEQIAKNAKERPIVLLCGPSSSGKTTTNDRLRRVLEAHGIRAEMISMDDYYRTVGSYTIPQDEENQVEDLESPACMDLQLLHDHLRRLVRGEEVPVPRFDFETRTSVLHDRVFTLDPDEVVLIEGIHSFNPVITGDLRDKAIGVSLLVASSVVVSDTLILEPQMLRFLRRAMRDSLFRNSPVSATIKQWNSVRRGERLYITPYLEAASCTIDTYLPYETCILASFLAKRLSEEAEALERAGLRPLLDAMDRFAPIQYAKHIPEDSVLHEFIG